MDRMGFYHYMMGEQPNAAVKTWFTDKFVQWRDILINANMNKSVWGNPPWMILLGSELQ